VTCLLTTTTNEDDTKSRLFLSLIKLILMHEWPVYTLKRIEAAVTLFTSLAAFLDTSKTILSC